VIALTQVGGNLLTNGLLVAVVALTHIQVAAFLIGATTLMIVSESVSLARRGHDARHDRLAHGLIKTSLYVFGFGSALAIFFVLWVLSGVWGRFFIDLQRITFWVFFLEAITFVGEIVTIYTLYANWERLDRYRLGRIGMLILLNIMQFLQMFWIDVVASYMMTPNSGDLNFLNQTLNPTALPLDLHRVVGNIAFAAALLALVAGFKYLRATRRLERTERQVTDARPALSIGAMAAEAPATEPYEAAESRYWDWAGQWGAVWAVGLTLLQPWLGYSYAKEIQLHAYSSWYTMMFGDLSNVFLVQITLLGTIFVLGTTYFWRRMKNSGASHHRHQGVLALALVIVTLFAALPSWFAPTYADAVAAGGNKPFWEGGLLNPIGNFLPYKLGALFMMIVLGLWSVTSYMRAYGRGQLRPGLISRRAQYALLGLGVTVSVMMMVMGVIREHARQPYLINGEMTINQQQITNNNPSPQINNANPQPTSPVSP
jgi:hypothetical protein